jgi:lysophospholipase L1-like esterase
VTPLSRRNFNVNGTIDDTLGPWAGYTLSVARETGTATIDLWRESIRYLEAVGEEQAMRFNLNPEDHTHLNEAGSVVFGRMVSDLLIASLGEDVECITRRNRTMSDEIRRGVMSF